MKKFLPISNNFIGQDDLIKKLSLHINSVLKNQQTCDHILLSGPAGYGKTALLKLICRKLKIKAHFLHGPHIYKPSQLITALTFLKNNEILFLDEIHAIKKNILEILYQALDEKQISLVLGKDNNSKIVNLKLNNFSLFACTTELHKLPPSLIDRFGINESMQNYKIEEILQIINKYQKILKTNFNQEEMQYISLYCRLVPRVAIQTFKRICEYYKHYQDESKDKKEIIKNAIHFLNLSILGLTLTEKNYLQLLFKARKPVGLGIISIHLNENIEFLQKFVEPYLVQNNLIKFTSIGRVINNDKINLIESLFN